MKKTLVTLWLTVLCFLLLGNVYAWEVPSYMRIDAGARMWFTAINGDLIQADRTKLGLTDNLGLKEDKLAWEFFGSARIDNIHVLRCSGEIPVTYDNAVNNSYLKTWNIIVGHDLDFYMTPQMLFGSNSRLAILNLNSAVTNVTVGAVTYNYNDNRTRVIPSLGFHGTFYPILDGVSLRPSISSRINWWNYESLKTWDWEVSGSVDVPINGLWTWSVNGGYRIWRIEMERNQDTIDLYRRGFFLQTSLLF
jgi:hypothetical protein